MRTRFKFEKSLYALKRSHKNWNEKFNTLMLSSDFVCSEYEY